MPARQAFARARIVVVPSRAEAMPYIVIEALGAGRPMIASAVGGIPEIFATAPNALVGPEAGAIAAKMAEALADEDAYAATMPDRAFLTENFSADVMSARIGTIYQDTVARVR
ncbi:MAG: glycosyltransferase, partial [Nitratireductor sp.]